MVEMHNIAAIARSHDTNCQDILLDAVVAWRQSGVNVVGVLAEDNETAGECSAAFLRDIASERRFRVNLDVPPAGAICHLDPEGMDEAGQSLLAQIAAADIVVLSKFGKLETMKRGLWAAFAAAVAAHKPLLTTVSTKHRPQWSAFAPDAAWANGDLASLERWRLALQPRATAGAARASREARI